MTDTLCVLEHRAGERPEAIVGFLCSKHRRKLDADVAEIGYLIVDSMRIRDGGAPQEAKQRVRHTKKPEAPAPADLDVIAIYDARTSAMRLAGTTSNPLGDDSPPVVPVASVVASWLQLLAEERPLTAALPSSLLAQLDLLKRHHDWIAAQPWVDDYLSELGETRRQMATVVHDHKFTRVGTCDLPVEDRERCGGPLLIENGSDTVRCGNCRATWTDPRERARLAMRL